MVDGVTVQHHQLQGSGQLEYSLNLGLNFSYTRRPGVWAFHKGSFTGVVEKTPFGQRDIGAHPRDDHPVEEVALTLCTPDTTVSQGVQGLLYDVLLDFVKVRTWLATVTLLTAMSYKGGQDRCEWV